MESNLLIGSLTAAYTATQYTGGVGIPRVGDVYHDLSNNKKYIFLKFAGTTAAAKLAFRATTTDLSNFFCREMDTTIANNELLFAGARVSGSTTLNSTNGIYGWFQVRGSITMTASSDTTTASLGVVASNQSAGQLEAAADSAAGIRGTFGIAETTTSSGDVVVYLNRNVWGI